ncbi:hypothetical protein [Kribbella sp. NPDC051620]|uniref:hypothetical protein n=1 Tax=Kribbella sp. NPDC051620 TaxID=3364120 RepID=UPI003791FD83
MEILRTAGNSRMPAGVLEVSAADDIEFVLTYRPLKTPEQEDQALIRGTGIETLTGFLEGTGPVVGADVQRLGTAARAKAEQDDLSSYDLWSIRDAVGRWFHKAGLSHEWIEVEGGAHRRIEREHVLLRVPQAGTDRSVMYSIDFRTVGRDNDHFTFTEEYRAPDEVLGYTYTVPMAYGDLPVLAAYLAEQLGIADEPADPEDLLIRCLEEAIAGGRLDPGAGQATARDQVARWRAAAGVEWAEGPPGYDRREVLLQQPRGGDRLVTVSLSIGSYNKQLRFEESYGVSDQTYRDGHYQVEIPWTAAETLLGWLEARVGEQAEGLSVDDRLVRAFGVLAERGELAPGRPMAVRDRVAGWLTAAGVEFKSWGHDWKETLLSVYRERTNCIFTLKLTLDATDEKAGIHFSEHYDYLPGSADTGREYAYSVQTPFGSAEALVEYFDQRLGQPTSGTLSERLVASFAAVTARGELADHLPLEENRDRVARWFTEAGVPLKTEKWSWFNSD